MTPLEKDIDARIVPYVMALRKARVDTEWSCEGHANERYPTGFTKPQMAIISGPLKNLKQIGTITKVLTKMTSGCFCGTCSVFDIQVSLAADACGPAEPECYRYSVRFYGTIKEMEQSVGRARGRARGKANP